MASRASTRSPQNPETIMRPCLCGSGLALWWEYDARGISREASIALEFTIAPRNRVVSGTSAANGDEFRYRGKKRSLCRRIPDYPFAQVIGRGR
jgi:hypothetical protein